MGNPRLIAAFYESNDADPVLVMRYLSQAQLKSLSDRLSQAGVHGLTPEVFDASHLNQLLRKIYDKKAICRK